MSLKLRLKNTLTVIVSIVVFLLVLEVVVLNWLMPLMPLKVHHHFYSFRILAQPTKQAALPNNYVAILGDSFAHGAGDWLFSADHNNNPPFHSTHVIHKSTGRDVVSFASSGRGSIDGLILDPVRVFETINSSPFIKIPPPETVVIYFYEGNDLANNVRDIFRQQLVGMKPRNVTAPSKFSAQVTPIMTWHARRYLDRPSNTFKRFIYVTRGFFNLARRNWKIVTGSEVAQPHEVVTANLLGNAHSWLQRDGLNLIRVGAFVAGAPDLQGPSVELEAEELGVGAELFERSLEFIRGYFPESKFLVVYIPSPLSIYEFVDGKAIAVLQVPDRTLLKVSSSQIREASTMICMLILAATKRTKTRFLDTRHAFRKAAREELLHGPMDEDHFNQRGYSILGELVATRLVGKDDGRDVCQE